MFGLDDRIAELSNGASVGVVILVAVLLGLRHATDPDHIAAVSTLVASGRENARRAAARLGVWWGLGHAITLVALRRADPPLRGVPAREGAAGRGDARRGGDRLPRAAAARCAGGAAASICIRTTSPASTGMRCARAPRRSASGSSTAWAAAPASACSCSRRSPTGPWRSPRSSCSRVFTAVSMTIVTTGFGAAIGRGCAATRCVAAVPVLGVASLAFGAWYAAAVWSLAPYPF